MTTHKKKCLRTCPHCGKNTFVISIFGSICSNEDCFYEGKKTEKVECNDPDCKLPSYAHNNVKPEGFGEWENDIMRMIVQLDAPLKIETMKKGYEIQKYVSTLLLQEKAKWKGELKKKVEQIDFTVISAEYKQGYEKMEAEVLTLIDKL